MSDIRRRPAPSERLYALLLGLFPTAFRSRFGDDMRELFRDQHRAARARDGLRGVGALWVRTLPALLGAALLERRDARGERARTTHRLVHLTGSTHMLETLASDLRYAARRLRRSPAFALVTVFVVALGTGAVATIYSAINALALRPLPGTMDGGRLVGVQRVRPGQDDRVSASYAYVRHLRERTRTLDGVAAWSRATLSIADRGEGHAAAGNLVTANYFSVLGVRPALGRFFRPDEDRVPMANPVVVLSHGFWRTRLGGDSSVVGRTLAVNGRPYSVIGVAPAEFRGVFTPLVTDAWLPVTMQPHVRPGLDLAHRPWLWTIGRLREGASDAQARAELAALTAEHAAAAPAAEAFREHVGVEVVPLTGLPSDARRTLMGFGALLMGAAALLLLIASVNVAALLSARALSRRREMALRTAIGAGRSRLVRQLLTETLLLFAAGAIGGVGLAWVATAALERLPLPADAALALELSPDARVLGFALVVSLLTGLAFGLAPALQGTGADVASRLRDGTAGGGRRRSRGGSVLVAGQLALSLVLLVAAGLFVRALGAGAGIDPGFVRDGVAMATFDTQALGRDEAWSREFYRALRERVEAIPGVTAVSFTNMVPLSFSGSGDEVVLGADARERGQRDGRVPVLHAAADVGYFDVLRLPLVRGRGFGPEDAADAPRVAVVNETLARRHWPDGDAVGRTFTFHDTTVTIVGIARDAKYGSLGERTPAFVYFPVAQRWQARQDMFVRTDGDPARVAPAVRAAVRAIDAAIPRPVVQTLEEGTSIALLPQRVAAIVTGVLGGVGLLLATVGLYGVVMYTVNGRTREIGVRVALGARRADVLRLVVSDGMRLTAAGVLLGLVLAAAVTRLLASLLFDVSPLDGLTYAAMAALFVAVALVASWLPARRAAATTPMAALRTE